VDSETLALFSGNANAPLAHDIARHLRLPVGRAAVSRFSDGELNVEIMENVRGRDVFIVQPTCPPANGPSALNPPPPLPATTAGSAPSR